MGLNVSYLNFIESSIGLAFGGSVDGLRMLELGDQVIMDATLREATGKQYFTDRGFVHTSVDINGLHGSVVRDLRKPELFHDWHGAWDIVTNSGTTEHVEPYESQYECFGVIHDCIRRGGLSIHLVPDVKERDERKAWSKHCHNFYSTEFFELLARECHYELLANALLNGLRCVALRKTSDVPFMSDRAAFLGAIARRRLEKPSKLRRTANSLLRRLRFR